jgi:serine O-acetyltransferase
MSAALLDRAALDLTAIVAALREQRERFAPGDPRSAHPHPLPRRAVLGQVVEALQAALYPNRPGLPEAGADLQVGQNLENALSALREQVRLEGSGRGRSAALEEEASRIVAAFAEQLPRIRALLDSDLEAAYRGDPAARSLDEVLVCYPGVKAITYHRIAHALNQAGAPLVARVIAEIAHAETGVDIHPGAVIGESFFIDHGTGVVIGGTAVIGKRVRIYQAVTLGAKSFPMDERGMLVKGEARHPIVEDDVVIYAGATILGRVTIGHRAQIGGNVWLTRSIAADTTITQAKVISETFGEGGGI